MDLCKGLEGKNRKLWTCQVNTDPSTLQHVRACRVTTGMSDSVILCTAAHQASLCMGFSRQEYWSGLPCSPPGGLPDSGSEPLHWQVCSLPLAPLGSPAAHQGSEQVAANRPAPSKLPKTTQQCPRTQSFLVNQGQVLFFFFKFTYFWLHWVFIAARRLSSCREQGLLFAVGHRLLGGLASLVTEHEL